MQSLEQLIADFLKEAGSSEMDLCLTMEGKTNGKAWAQITCDALNMSFPTSAQPLQYLKAIGVALPKRWEVLDYEADAFATFQYAPDDIPGLVQFIQQYFHSGFKLALAPDTVALKKENLGKKKAAQPVQAPAPQRVVEWEAPAGGIAAPNGVVLKPKDKVTVQYDSGEFYADYPAQTILTASRGSTGVIVSAEDFKADFIRRMGQRSLSPEQKQAYLAHFAVVEQAMAFGLQYPVRFEKVERPAQGNLIVLSRPQTIHLVDGAAVVKTGGGGGGLAGLFGQSAPKPAPPQKIVWPPAGPHDQAKLTDMELALIMSNPKPPGVEDIEFVYLRFLSTLSFHNLWYRLRQVAAEAAFDIIDSLRFKKHNHAGYSWDVIAEMIEKNDPRKRLWYTEAQQEALIVAATNIYRLEQEQGLGQ
jgi:hypothetical protein